MDHKQKHWIIRVKDGENFRNSNYPFWGVKRGCGKNGAQKTVVKKMKPGDILWFLTSKDYGSKFIGMCEYTCFYDRDDEPLIAINTKTNADQNWTGDENWTIEIHYTKLYVTEKQNITACIPCGGSILEYETFQHLVNGDLYEHYRNFIFYAEPKQFTSTL